MSMVEMKALMKFATNQGINLKVVSVKDVAQLKREFDSNK